MREVRKTKVVYEALGKQHFAFTDSTNLEYIQEVLNLICPTAHLVSVSDQRISATLAEKLDLAHVIKWNDQLNERFNHIDKEAIT